MDTAHLLDGATTPERPNGHWWWTWGGRGILGPRRRIYRGHDHSQAVRTVRLCCRSSDVACDSTVNTTASSDWGLRKDFPGLHWLVAPTAR